VNLAVNVSLGVVYNAVREMVWQSHVGHEVIGINCAPRLDVLGSLTVKHVPLAIRNYGGSDFTFTVEKSQNFGFATNPARVKFPTPCAANVHIAGLAADESFVYFDFATGTAELLRTSQSGYQAGCDEA
jgi:hypothetical protein